MLENDCKRVGRGSISRESFETDGRMDERYWRRVLALSFCFTVVVVRVHRSRHYMICLSIK